MEPYELTDRDAELLSAYIDDALDADLRASLEARLAQDADLRWQLRSLQQTVALVRSLEDVRAPRDFTLTPEMVGLGDPTPAEQARPALKIVPRRRNIWQVAMTSAAAFVLVFAGVLVVMRVMNNQTSPTEMPAQVAAAPTLTAEVLADEAANEAENTNMMVATLAQTTTVQVEGYSSRQAIEATPVVTIVDGVAIVTPAVNMPTIPEVTPLPTQSISATTIPGAANDTGMVPPVPQTNEVESDDTPSDQTFAMEAPQPSPSDEPIALAVQQATPTLASTPMDETQASSTGTGGTGSDTDGEAEIEMAEEAQESTADSAAMETAPLDADAALGGAASAEESVPKTGDVVGMLLGGLYRSSAETTLFRLPDEQVITLQDALDIFLRIAAGIVNVGAAR